METIYLILILVLFLLAISDLIVGVSNDAVNFLNSAVGSKAAPLKIVMLVAALGVLAGTVFSGGYDGDSKKRYFLSRQVHFW
jgi:phosphate/sulfate permease